MMLSRANEVVSEFTLMRFVGITKSVTYLRSINLTSTCIASIRGQKRLDSPDVQSREMWKVGFSYVGHWRNGSAVALQAKG